MQAITDLLLKNHYRLTAFTQAARLCQITRYDAEQKHRSLFTVEGYAETWSLLTRHIVKQRIELYADYSIKYQ
jgi:hypothetical protein